MMTVLVHGTTLQRATKISAQGPDVNFIEPGGSEPAKSFSTYLESGPFPLGTPEEYACRKAAQFPSEGGAVILKMDVPDDIIALAVDPVIFPLSAGIV